MQINHDDFTFSAEALASPETPDQLAPWELTSALLAKLSSLESIYQEISLEGRISRDQAQFLQENCGIEFGEQYPLASFTVDPTATNLSIATEAMGSSFLTTIGDFLKKVATIIIDILKWIFDVLTGYSMRQQNVAKVADNIKVLSKANTEAEVIIRQSAPAPGTPPAELDACMEAVKAATVVHEQSWNDFRDQVVVQGDFVQFLRSFSVYILGFMPQLSARVDAFKRLIETEVRESDVAGMVGLKAQFARLAEPVPVNALYSALEHARLGAVDAHGRATRLVNPTFYDVAQAVNKQYTTLSTQHSSKVIPYQDCTAVLEANPKLIEPYLVREGVERKLVDHLITDYRRILGVQPKQTYSDDLREQYRTVVEQLTTEVKALQLLVTTYNEADLETVRLIKSVGDCVFRVNEALVEKAKTLPKASQEQVMAIVNKARSSLKRLGY